MVVNLVIIYFYSSGLIKLWSFKNRLLKMIDDVLECLYLF